mmetsp:Transcript_45232/g.120310  ORF Transcript_45232/g.120310 Transcript_45232/m.120310 type:complete len:389 (-) Transcript_45232:220-1386(-)
MSARSVPPVSEIMLSHRRRRVRVEFFSRASMTASAPSSPRRQRLRSRLCRFWFWDSTAARLTTTSLPSGFSLRRSSVRLELHQRVSAQARPPKPLTLLPLQLQNWRQRLASRALARAMQPRSSMSLQARSSDRSAPLPTSADAMAHTPAAPSWLPARLRVCRQELDERLLPATAPTSGPPSLLDRSRLVRDGLDAMPAMMSTSPAVPSPLLLSLRICRVELRWSMALMAAAARDLVSSFLSAVLPRPTPLRPSSRRQVLVRSAWPKAVPTALLKRLANMAVPSVPRSRRRRWERPPSSRAKARPDSVLRSLLPRLSSVRDSCWVAEDRIALAAESRIMFPKRSNDINGSCFINLLMKTPAHGSRNHRAECCQETQDFLSASPILKHEA